MLCTAESSSTERLSRLSQLTHVYKSKQTDGIASSSSSKMTQSGVPPVICEICSQTFDKEDLKIKAPTHFLGKKHQKSMFRSNYIKPAIFLPGIKIKIHKWFFLIQFLIYRCERTQFTKNFGILLDLWTNYTRSTFFELQK